MLDEIGSFFIYLDVDRNPTNLRWTRAFWSCLFFHQSYVMLFIVSNVILNCRRSLNRVPVAFAQSVRFLRPQNHQSTMPRKLLYSYQDIDLDISWVPHSALQDDGKLRTHRMAKAKPRTKAKAKTKTTTTAKGNTKKSFVDPKVLEGVIFQV